ncbi:MAG TPA: hypothetical protein VGN70_06480 [Gammaproteobacteria bacterium]|jgi:hypothetical protein
MTRHLIVFGTLAAALALTGCSVRDSGSEPVTLKTDIPAAGLQFLSLKGTAGETSISVSPDDAVHVTLVMQQEERHVLGIALSTEATLRDTEGAKIGQVHKGDTLTLSVIFPSGDDHNSDVKQEWTVQVPERFGVDASMGEGRMAIDGVKGGVKAQLAAGEVVIHVPSGAIYGRLSAGRLHVISDADEPRDVTIKSTFGLAVLSLDGQYYGPPPEKNDGFLSHLHMLGNSVTQQGKGKDDVDLKVTAGLADLRFGPLGDNEVRRDIFKDDKH